MEPLDTFDFELDGVAYVAELTHDAAGGRPWERNDGHGPMRRGCRDSKRPGERVCGEIGRLGGCWLYDWQAASATARREGWPAGAVQADFDRLDGWLRDRWWWCILEVRRADGLGDSEYLGGIESDAGREYFLETARELAGQVAYNVRLARSHAVGVRYGMASAAMADGCEVTL